MTKLLVSVRNAEEALAAIEGGAEIVDVKEPAHGPLGAAEPETWQKVAMAVRGWKTLSAALGELRDRPDRWFGRSIGLLAGYRYAKVGLAGCASDPQWVDRWRDLLRLFPRHVSPVAVVYADYQQCGAPEPMEILSHGVELGCKAILVDTFQKRTGDLWQYADEMFLRNLIAESRARGLTTAVAGSLMGESLGRAVSVEPDYVAVRGAVCSGGRIGRVSAVKVRDALHVLDTAIMNGNVSLRAAEASKMERRSVAPLPQS